jgi:hypothetical protein
VYIFRNLIENNVVPLYAMEADIYCVDIGKLTFNIGSRQMWVVSMSAFSTLMPEIKLWFILRWSLGGCWSWSGCFGVDVVLLLMSRNEPQFLQHVSNSFYSLQASYRIDNNRELFYIKCGKFGFSFLFMT